MKANEISVGQTIVVGKVDVTRLETCYYSFLWENEEFTKTELVHPWNVMRRLQEING